MEFDKSKVYTSLNADELKPGSKVFVSNVLSVLIELVEKEDVKLAKKVQSILPDNEERRIFTEFNSEKEFYESQWAFAYLIEEPRHPYKNRVQAFYNLADVHWLQRKENGDYVQIFNICENHVCLIEDGVITEVPYSTLLEDYEIYSFSGTNIPCGILEK